MKLTRSRVVLLSQFMFNDWILKLSQLPAKSSQEYQLMTIHVHQAGGKI